MAIYEVQRFIGFTTIAMIRKKGKIFKFSLILPLILLYSSCTTIQTTITSDPPGAEIYSGPSKESLKPLNEKTPYSWTFTDIGAHFKPWYFQVKKGGFYDSDIIFKPKEKGDRTIHFSLNPLSKTDRKRFVNNSVKATEGFRDLRWGDRLSDIRGMHFISKDDSLMGMDYYRRPSDSLQIGGANIDSINYGFWNGELVHVTINVSGGNYYPLKDATFKKFGKGFQHNRYMEDFFWETAQSYISLKYRKVLDKGRLFMTSKIHHNMMKKHREKKAIEGAETGF